MPFYWLNALIKLVHPLLVPYYNATLEWFPLFYRWNMHIIR